MLRATTLVRRTFVMEAPADQVLLEAGERHLRRKLLKLQSGGEVLVDLERTQMLESGDCLMLEDGRLIKVQAVAEALLEVRGRDAWHLTALAWHIGNRHLEAQIEVDRILIRRDHVIATMLEQLGATVTEVSEPFSPEHGAYRGHGH
jgi:urease accessory protein